MTEKKVYYYPLRMVDKFGNSVVANDEQQRIMFTECGFKPKREAEAKENKIT